MRNANKNNIFYMDTCIKSELKLFYKQHQFTHFPNNVTKSVKRFCAKFGGHYIFLYIPLIIYSR